MGSVAPLTADERERQIVEYLSSLNKGQLAEFKLRRMNRISNFRKRLMELLNEMIEARAEDLAAGMLMEHAEPRPVPGWKLRGEKQPMVRKRRIPPWIRKSGEAERRG